MALSSGEDPKLGETFKKARSACASRPFEDETFGILCV